MDDKGTSPVARSLRITLGDVRQGYHSIKSAGMRRTKPLSLSGLVRLEPEEFLKVNIADVPAEWWSTEEGHAWRKEQELQSAWAGFLGKFEWDAWFTLTYRNPAQSAMLAVDRAARLVRLACKRLKLNVQTFIVAEQHRNGSYHCHGLMRLGALSSDLERMILTAFWQIALDLYGRNSFALVKDNNAVRVYVSKYLTKQPADWRFVNVTGLKT